jgi:hypothetical protein
VSSSAAAAHPAAAAFAAAAALLLAAALPGCRAIACEGSCACDRRTCACSGAADCTVECRRPGCDVTCATSGDCDFAVGADASVTCDGAGACRVTCEASCEVGCSGGGMCQVECAPGADCSIVGCPGVVLSCGDLQVCGGPCTG